MAAKALPLQQGVYGLSSPSRGFAITPTDGTPLAQTTRAIYVGVAGDVTGILADDTAPVTFKALAVGVHFLAFKQVNATGTAATDMLGLY